MKKKWIVPYVWVKGVKETKCDDFWDWFWGYMGGCGGGGGQHGGKDHDGHKHHEGDKHHPCQPQPTDPCEVIS